MIITAVSAYLACSWLAERRSPACIIVADLFTKHQRFLGHSLYSTWWLEPILEHLCSSFLLKGFERILLLKKRLRAAFDLNVKKVGIECKRKGFLFFERARALKTSARSQPTHVDYRGARGCGSQAVARMLCLEISIIYQKKPWRSQLPFKKSQKSKVTINNQWCDLNSIIFDRLLLFIDAYSSDPNKRTGPNKRAGWNFDKK